MKLGLEDRKKTTQLAVVGVGALVAVYFLYSELFGGPAQTPPAPPVILTRTPASAAPANAVTAPPGAAVRTAQHVGGTGQQLDPSLHMEAMHRTEALVYTGTGRNIFAAGPPPAPPAPKLVQAKFPARPVAPVYTAPVPTGPPPPPPINLKFFGTATTADGNRKAFLLSGDDVYLAATGDVVAKRYRVVSIAQSSVLVEDLPNSNRQSLPLNAN